MECQSVNNLSNYATKAELKRLPGIDISKLASKTDLANLKTNADKLEVDNALDIAEKDREKIKKP